MESFSLNGREKDVKFGKTKEILDWDKFWTIKEIKMERTWESNHNSTQKKFSFRIDDISKTLTVNQIKKIMKDEYWYYEDALSVNILDKGDTKWTSICTSDDIIHITLDIKKNDEIRKHLEQQWDSPYKEMIEKQTGPIESNPNKQEIAITIDDWYNNKNKNLEKMLAVLNKRWIKATFFTLWEVLSWDKDEIRKKEVSEKWHQICCHTYSHVYIEDSKTTELFKGHNISESSRKEHVKQREKYVKKLLPNEYDKIRKSNPKFPREVNTATLLDVEIRMREIQVERSLWKDYLLNMKRNFPFFRFPWNIWSKRPENIQVLKDHWYLSIGRTHESWKDKNKQIPWWIELFHVNDNVANNFERYLDELWMQGTNVTNIVTPE